MASEIYIIILKALHFKNILSLGIHLALSIGIIHIFINEIAQNFS